MNLKLKYYKTLIQHLPVLEQAFQIKAVNWNKLLNQNQSDKLFKDKDYIAINRLDIFNTQEQELFVLKILLWGYPKGMRGNNFSLISQSIEKIVEILNDRRADLTTIQCSFSDITGLGLSTYSKFLYFKKYTFGEYSALILDERLIKVFQQNVFEEFETLKTINSYNKEKMYMQYLEIMHEQAANLNTKPENIEQFLFLFGNHLKK